MAAAVAEPAAPGDLPQPSPALHDYVVQSKGAFDATVAGILNLARLKQRIEIRVVVHKQTAPHLVEIAEFISRNLPFVDQVALMGLEMIGFARANVDDVWIDPVEYREELIEAVTMLDRRGLRALVYNHPLCLIDRKLWSHAVRSISDWKNEYHPSACAAASPMTAAASSTRPSTVTAITSVRSIRKASRSIRCRCWGSRPADRRCQRHPAGSQSPRARTRAHARDTGALTRSRHHRVVPQHPRCYFVVRIGPLCLAGV